MASSEPEAPTRARGLAPVAHAVIWKRKIADRPTQRVAKCLCPRPSARRFLVVAPTRRLVDVAEFYELRSPPDNTGADMPLKRREGAAQRQQPISKGPRLKRNLARCASILLPHLVGVEADDRVKSKIQQVQLDAGAPGTIRTSDPQIRSLMLQKTTTERRIDIRNRTWLSPGYSNPGERVDERPDVSWVLSPPREQPSARSPSDRVAYERR